MALIKIIVAALLCSALTIPATSTAQSCLGDCNADGAVTADELTTGVNIILGTRSIAECPAFSRGAVAVDVSDLVAAVSHALNGCPVDPLVVTTDKGTVRGASANDIRSFFGIPYAAPPVGELRWAPPQPHSDWSGERPATSPGSVCSQLIPFLNSQAGSEDCLYLNVQAPETPPAQPLPVMVWIHGGGFVTGDGLQFGGTDGSDIIRRKDVVTVSINYRLGELGFLAHSELTQRHGSSGNFGIQDQIAALQWVQRNIANFGGDPTNVTIYGESAGGWSVCMHLASPESAGLFHRAIIQSGICTQRLPTLGAAEAQGRDFAERLGCGIIFGEVDCMRGKSVEEVRSVLPPDPNFAFSEGEFGAWFPNVDGVLLDEQIAEALAAGRFNKVPVLIGSNRDEGTLFVALAHDFAGTPLEAGQYEDRLTSLILDPDALAAVLERYPLADFTTPGEALATAFGDGLLACPTIRAAQLLAEHVPTYQYQFDFPDAPFALPLPVDIGAFHSAENQYVFGRRLGAPFSPVESALSLAMTGYWTEFADTGNPNSSETPAWPELGASGELLLLDEVIASAEPPKTDECTFWENLGYDRAPLEDPLVVEAEMLRAARLRWQATGVTDYRMRYRRSCFCPGPSEFDIVVRDGEIESATDPSDGSPIDGPGGSLFSFLSIDELFDLIEQAITDGADIVEVEYDPMLSYPTRASFDFILGAIDDELGVSVIDLVPLDD